MTIVNKTTAKNKILNENSSSTIITDGNNFTGVWVDVSAYSRLVIAVATDQNGYYEVQFSPDGTNTDSTLTRYYRTNQINAPEVFTITRKFFRIRFFNDSGADQTYFRLQVMLGDFPDLNIPVDSIMSQDYGATSVRPTSFKEEVALGRRQGWETWNKFGYNDDIDTASDEVIAAFGGAFDQRLSSGETLSVVSSSANDTNSAGTGVRQVVIFGINENWDLQTEVLALNGTSTVTTSNSWLGINRMTIFTSGSANSNVGTITATASSSGNTMATMPAGDGTTQQCLFYVPRNYQFLMTWWYLNAIKDSGGGSPKVTFKAFVYSDIVSSQFEIYRDQIDTTDTQDITVSLQEPFPIGERSIVWFESGTSGNNTSVQGRFSGKLVRDADA